MLPVRLPASHRDGAYPDAGGRVATTATPALLALDEHLFNPAPSAWLVIDAGNQAVKGVTLPSLRDGLELIGRCRIAALVGRLRDGVGVVDVDVPGDFGVFIAHEVAGWLEQHDCWVLLRPSGGAEGRYHVFFAHPDFHYAPTGQRTHLAAEVTHYLAALASELRLRRGDLDLRDAVRPLSSPHRRGTRTRPHGDARQALRALTRLLPTPPEPAPLRRRPHPSTPDRTRRHPPPQDAVVGLFPLPRPGRALTAEWRHYLLTGTPPPDHPGTRMGDRSLIEAALTLELVWCGHDPHTAWQTIREAHPAAMTKARHQGRGWWLKYVWNPAVTDVNAFHPHPYPHQQPTDTTTSPPEGVLEAVAAAREALTALMWTQTPRRRPALLLVGHHLLDRMARTGRLRVPCPERDLLLDTGIADRKTIRGILRLLHGHLGTLHTDCLSPTERDSTSYEFEINPSPGTGGRQIPPPRSHPPPPVRGLWATLPRTSHSLWRTLQAEEGALPVEELARKAGLVPEPDAEPTKSHKTTAKAALAALGRAGMARVDEHGHWRAASRPRSTGVEERAAAAHQRQLQEVEAERAAYRAGGTSSWNAGRARALKAQRAKEKAWWHQLSPLERHQRQEEYSHAFEQLSVSQQATLKARLADRRTRAGVNEPDHHQEWVDSLTPDEYAARSEDRKERFRRLSPTQRGMSVAAWHAHRVRYGLTTDPQSMTPQQPPADRTSHEQALHPDGPALRDAAFLERQIPLVDDTGLASGRAG